MRGRSAGIFTRKGAAVAIGAVAVINLALAREYLEGATYLGVLFAVGGVALLKVAVRLWRSRDLVAWTVGGVAATCMFVGFILSRTAGLPSVHEGEWDPYWIAAVLLEAAYLGAMGWWLSTPRRPAQHERRGPARRDEARRAVA